MAKNADLHRNLGLPGWLVDQLLRPGALGRRALAVLSASALPLEVPLLALLDALPARLRRAVVAAAWLFWRALHRALPSRFARRGLSAKLSLEAHALSNVFWWARVFPATIRRTRFALGQMDGTHPPSRQLRAEPVGATGSGLCSLYLHTSRGEADHCALLWLFGGAYVGGGVRATAGLAERYGRKLGCDVFMADMRLCPEHSIQDAFADAYRGYEWLLSRFPPERIVVYGMSSGGGVALRVLQLAGATAEERAACSLPPGPLPQPAGAVLCGPWVRYTTPSESMSRNPELDLVVNPSIFELLEPRMGEFCGGEARREWCSPLYHDMAGLCPLMVSVSEHEVCIDEDLELAQKARAAGVHVDVDLVQHMPHAFQWMAGFLPEADEAEDRIVDWVRGRGPAWRSSVSGEGAVQVAS